MRRCTTIFLLLALAACQADPGLDPSRQLGSIMQFPSAGEAGVLEVAGVAPVLRREHLETPDRSIEVLRLADGFIGYQRLAEDVFAPDVDGTRVIESVLSDPLFRRRGIAVIGPILRGRNLYGPYATASAGNRETRCFVFGQVFFSGGASRYGGGDSELRAIRCTTPGQAAGLAAETLELLHRIRVRLEPEVRT